MWSIKNRPIKQKLQLVITLSCSAALLLSASALVCYQIVAFQTDFEGDLKSLGAILADKSAAAIQFKNPTAGDEQLLDTLRLKPQISYAEIRTPDGAPFAHYGTVVERVRDMSEGIHAVGRHHILFKKIILDGEEVGTFILVSEFWKEFRHLLFTVATILGSGLALSILAALLISTRLQRVISDPILALARTAKAIAEDRDYSVRAHKLEDDEIGLFTDAFNQMLGRIEDQDAELRVSRQKFETLIHSIEGTVLELEPGNLRVKFVSRQAERLLGYDLSEWTEMPQFFSSRIHDEDRERVLNLYTESITRSPTFAVEFRLVAKDGRQVWVRNSTSIVDDVHGQRVFRSIMLDITESKKAEKELEEVHQQLVQTSRQAGMAEIATGVLHNVGNVLNSVNISATLVSEKLRNSEARSLGMVCGLLQQHRLELGLFLTHHPKGSLVPEFLEGLAAKLERTDAAMSEEIQLLLKNVEHMKDIVGMQQSHAKMAGLMESLEIEPLIEDAIQLAYGNLAGSDIELTRNFEHVPRVSADKHQVLQILVNLFGNAKHAVQDDRVARKQVSVSVRRQGTEAISVAIVDNGIGIPPENLTKIFGHGFTTKPAGHGFGLHSGALAAKAMGGSLRALSDGPWLGATFILQLPISP